MENFSFFSKNLRTYLFANDISRADLSKRLGVESASTVGKWINENRTPPGPIMKMLENLSGISTDEFINQDLTYQILSAAKYIDGIVADGPDMTISYQNNARATRLINHLEQVQDQLKAMVLDGEKLLEAVK